MKYNRPLQLISITAIVTVMVNLLLPAFHFLQRQRDYEAQAGSSTPPFTALKSIDVMKYTKDVIANQPSAATINNLVATLRSASINYVAVSLPMDPSSDYPQVSQPAPQDAYSFSQTWADAIHNAGLHVMWRGTWAGIEGLYGFPKLVGTKRFPTGTASSAATDSNNTWLGKTYQYIVNHPTFFANGDIWAPLPERTEGIFQDSTSFLPYSGAGIQTNYPTFFRDLKTISDQAFSTIGKNLFTGYTANNYSEAKSGWLAQSLIDTNGIIGIDYYGNNHTPEEMDTDLRAMAALYHHPIFLQEWGDYWNHLTDEATRSAYLQKMYTTMQKLVADGVLVGFNYWGGWVNNAEGILTKDDSGFHLNYRGQLLSDFYHANNTVAAQPIPTTNTTSAASTKPTSTIGSSPAPKTTQTSTTSGQVNGTATDLSFSNLSCPGPAEGSFTGCYYNDQNLNKLAFVRTDAAINFDWQHTAPNDALPNDHYSVQWQGKFYFEGGTYTFKMTSDDGTALFINGQPILNAWYDHTHKTYTATVELLPGTHTIRMDYYEATGSALAKLSWLQLSDKEKDKAEHGASGKNQNKFIRR